MDKVFVTSCFLVILSGVVAVACVFTVIWADQCALYFRIGLTSVITGLISSVVMRLTEPE